MAYEKYNSIEDLHNNKKAMLWNTLSNKQKVKLVLAFLVAFLFMELFWRMLFEFLIAYMQMCDALLA